MAERSVVFRRTLLGLGLALAGLCLTGPLAGSKAENADTVKLERLSYDAFKSRLTVPKASNARFTLVDAWSTTCGPCMENFPHLVEMHQKYGAKGLRVVSLSLDDNSDDKAIATAEKFLRDKKATFLNVLLDEEFGVGFDKLDINAIPAVFLFGPDGKEIKRFTLDDPNHQFTYADVEKEVQTRLGAK